MQLQEYKLQDLMANSKNYYYATTPFLFCKRVQILHHFLAVTLKDAKSIPHICDNLLLFVQ